MNFVKFFFAAEAVVLAVAIGMVSACQPDKEKVEAVVGFEDAAIRLSVAKAHAAKIKGEAYVVSATGSMKPTLDAGDVVVVDTHYPWGNLSGKMVCYQAKWRDRGLPVVCHWVGDRFGDGYITYGENNPNYENTKDTYLTKEDFLWEKEGKRVGGVVVAIYKAK